MSSWARTSSSPNLLHPLHGPPPPDLSFEGISAEIKVLQKLIHDASTNDLDGGRAQRLSAIITMLDYLKAKIQNTAQPSARGRPEFRRCNSDLRSTWANPSDDKDSLRRELNACLASRKSLEAMCSCLSKEKAIIASELAKKVHQLNGLEEHMGDLRAQNDSLLARLQACAPDHVDKKDPQGQANLDALQNRNKALSDQLLKSLDGYRSLKRKYKEAQEENKALVATMVEMEAEVGQALQRLREAPPADQVSELEHMLQSLNIKISKQR